MTLRAKMGRCSLSFIPKYPRHHLLHRPMAEVELADALIRILDFAGMKGYDLGGAVREKLDYNRTRSDHKKENRVKKF